MTRLAEWSRSCAYSMRPAQHPNGRAQDRHADPDLAPSLKWSAPPEAALRPAAVAAESVARRHALPELVRARFPAALFAVLPAALSAAPARPQSRSSCRR